MAIELKIPGAGESIAEVEIADWLKAPGDAVAKDEPVALIETEKASLEIFAPADGKLTRILKQKGEPAHVGEVIGEMEAGEPVAMPTPPPKPVPEPEPKTEPEPKSEPVAEKPVAREEVVRMSPLRRALARRLIEAQKTAALLTTFNEVDMFAVQELRRELGEVFQQRHGTKLGLMSFFIKATIAALKEFPVVNAEVRGEDIVYWDRYDIGIAVGTERGLVVPVLRDAEGLSFAETERAIAQFARQARENNLTPDDLQGGTFTITNGGVFGSLLSTPLINPPQSGILALHAIQERPVARQGTIVIRPMMYMALTYDHRGVDGREAVTFLRRIKELVETPARMLIET